MKRAYTILSAALIACAFAAPSARANVLVYYGFHPYDYGITTTDGTKSANTGSTTGNYTTNIATGAWWAVAPDGTRLRQVPATYSEGAYRFTAKVAAGEGANAQTMVYELAAR